jgi:mRNA-degrading endonuclease RelE of RelBE toxin-antitoxin system
MRRSEATSLGYTVEVSPPAWNQLAQLTVDTYRRIREELDAVAAELTEAGPRARVGDARGNRLSSSKPSVTIDDAIVVYDVDHERRRVLLVEVARRILPDLD